MFRYKDNWIVPQREHARLAGLVLDNFKDSYFESITKEIVLEATIFHQQGYPEFDDIDFRSPTENRNINIFLNDTDENIPIRDDALTLVMIHNLRILRETKIPSDNWKGFSEYADVLENKIDRRIKSSEFSYNNFWDSSHNIRLADRISFLLSEGKENSTEFFVNNVQYNFLLKRNVISLNPWVFKPSKFNLYLISYENKGYGEVNKPNVISFNFIERKN